jgi:hypothetical protein
VAARFGRLPSGDWPDPPSEAMVLPLQGDTGGPVGAIVLAASSGRALDAAYRDFLGLVARQTAALVNGAIAYQVQLRRAEELAELDFIVDLTGVYYLDSAGLTALLPFAGGGRGPPR